MILTCIDINNISTIIYNLVISVSVIIGGFWAYFKFRKRHEDASIIVNINRIRTFNDKINKRIVLITQILILNNGNREVKLYYDYPSDEVAKKNNEPEKHYKSEINLYYVETNNKNKLNKIGSEIGLTTGGKKQYTGRLRKGAEIKLPYILTIDKSGIYFLEYKIDINISSYFIKLEKKT
jgi:hypothetical protein